MTRTNPLQPMLLRGAIGFDSILRLADELIASAAESPAYPPYNIEKIADNNYRLVMAVAGFSRDDLEISIQEGALVVKGQVADAADDKRVFLHRGIGMRAFSRTFRLADNIHVRKADLAHGLLVIDLEREVPEAAKPRRIEIGSADTIEASALGA